MRGLVLCSCNPLNHGGKGVLLGCDIAMLPVSSETLKIRASSPLLVRWMSRHRVVTAPKTLSASPTQVDGHTSTCARGWSVIRSS